jgi:hypothetical protein
MRHYSKKSSIIIFILIGILIFSLLWMYSCSENQDSGKKNIFYPKPTTTPTQTITSTKKIVKTTPPAVTVTPAVILELSFPKPVSEPSPTSVLTPITETTTTPVLTSTTTPTSTITPIYVPSGTPTYFLKIKGPGDNIFNVSDGYWLPGKTLERLVQVKNIGNVNCEFYISCTGNEKPVFDAKGDGANVSLKVSWSDGKTEKQKWALLVSQSQDIILRAELPKEADNTCQGDDWEITFKFIAIQIE